ncbi:hypothetical protein ACNS7O_03520 [Haloferacaceae archaeon DSL9]
MVRTWIGDVLRLIGAAACLLVAATVLDAVAPGWAARLRSRVRADDDWATATDLRRYHDVSIDPARMYELTAARSGERCYFAIEGDGHLVTLVGEPIPTTLIRDASIREWAE